MGYFPLLHHPSASLPLLKSQQTGKPLFSSSTSVSMCPFPSFISILPLSANISPPLFYSLRRVHPPPLLWSNPTTINQLLVSSRGRLVSAPSSLPRFTVFSNQCLYALSTFISPPVTSPSLFLVFYFVLLADSVFNSIYNCFFFSTTSSKWFVDCSTDND